MPDWRKLVLLAVARNTPAELKPVPVEEIQFGEPASQVQLAEVETALKMQLPAQLRDALQSFNGAADQFGEPILFDTQNLIDFNQDIPARYADWDLPHPLANAIMFCDCYGNGDLSAICLKAFAEFLPGQVVRFDHERGQYTREGWAPDLASYLEHGAAPDTAAR